MRSKLHLCFQRKERPDGLHDMLYSFKRMLHMCMPTLSAATCTHRCYYPSPIKPASRVVHPSLRSLLVYCRSLPVEEGLATRIEQCYTAQ